MDIGVPKEIKIHEYRVGMTPSSVRELVSQGHRVYVEKDAALQIGFENQDYINAGAIVEEDPELIWAKSELIVKVKEPQPLEFNRLRPDQVLFTYLHLAPDKVQADALISSGCTAIAYETVTDPSGGLPLLAPMSIVAGRMSIQCGAHFLEISKGGRGQLLGGVPGVPPAKVVIFGGGSVGTSAARMAMGLGASVSILDLNTKKLYDLDNTFGPNLKTVYPNIDLVEELVSEADLVVGAVLVPGAPAPCVVKEKMVKEMNRGSVLVDVSIDQGGCFETSVSTTHDSPTYIVHDVIHYCVTNMPGAVARTSTLALNNATLPYITKITNLGWKEFMRKDSNFSEGLNVWQGKIIHNEVALALNKKPFEISRILN